MSLLNLAPNILWILTGGFWMAVGWLIAAAVMAVTIIGLPLGQRGFGKTIVSSDDGYSFRPRRTWLSRSI